MTKTDYDVLIADYQVIISLYKDTIWLLFDLLERSIQLNQE